MFDISDYWLPLYHIFWRFPNLQELSIAFRSCQESAETRFSLQLAHMDNFVVEEGSQEELVCERVEANLKSSQLIDPGTSESNQLWSPTAQLVGMVLGARLRIDVSAAQLKVTNSKLRSRSEAQEYELETDSGWSFHWLLLDIDFYSERSSGENIVSRRILQRTSARNC